MSTNLPPTAIQLPNQSYINPSISLFFCLLMAIANEGALGVASSSSYLSTRTTSSSFMSKLCSMLSSLSMHSVKKEKTKSPATSISYTPSTYSKSKIFGRVFRYFDENGDGKISPHELRNCINMSGDKMSLEEIQAVVDSVDSDGDGLLGYDDFVILMDDIDDEDRGRSLKEAFQVYEMKGEGCITANSLRQTLRLLGDSRSVEECKTMIRRFDLNGDGVLSFGEFENMMMNY